MEFPKEFDLSLYKTLYSSDLSNLTDEQHIYHYNKYGKNEGRICNDVTSRHKLVSYIPKNMKCLEIGPFNSPVLVGENIKYFEVLTKEELINRAISINRNPNYIPNIDFIDKNGNLRTIKEKFDVVLSCHSIEHQVDFIKHLQDVSELLNDKGLYVIILPDKRYCFDHFINETTIADIINTHNTHEVNSQSFHTLKSVIEHRALTCHNNPIRHWNNDHGILDVKTENIVNAIKEYNEGIKNGTYVDVHSLQFTPSSFENIIDILYELKYINLKKYKVYPTIKNSVEFFVILEKN
jgi:SAM-dependent methyltransferase